MKGKKFQAEGFCVDDSCSYYRSTKNIYSSLIITEDMKSYRDRWGLLTVL